MWSLPPPVGASSTRAPIAAALMPTSHQKGRDCRHKPNPVTVAIIRNAFNAIANEMDANLVRSAFSPVIYEMKDCSVALFNENAELLGQAAGLPLFLGALDEVVKGRVLEESELGLPERRADRA